MKKILTILGGTLTILAFAGAVWGVSSFWHNYCALEEIHEHDQANEIKEVNETALLAMNQSSLAISQQRAAWLEEQLVFYEREHGCREDVITSSCNDRVRRVYLKYLREFNLLQIEISKYLKEIGN